MSPLYAQFMTANYKFTLTKQTLHQYLSINDLLKATKNCEQLKCLPLASTGDTDPLIDCVKNCTTGIRQI